MYKKLIVSGEQDIAFADILQLFSAASNYTSAPLELVDIQELAAPTKILEIRQTVLDFVRDNQVDYLQQGMRFIIEPHEWPAKISLTNKPVAAQNFTDWLNPKAPWQPGLAKDQGGFFEKCAQAALSSAPPLINGAPIEFLSPEDKTVFAVKDGSPKTPGHYLILTTAPRANMLDPNFTTEEWIKTFQLAYLLFNKYAKPGQQLRLNSNNGQYMQRGPLYNFHVQFDEGFIPFDPTELGYTVDPETYCVQDDGSELFQMLKTTIENYKQANNDKDKLEQYHALKSFLESRGLVH